MRAFDSNLLRGKVVAVTDGATALGGAIAKLMAEHGAKVVVNGPPGEPITEVVRQIEAAGGTAVACGADVATREGAEAFVRVAMTTYAESKRETADEDARRAQGGSGLREEE